MNSLVDYRTNYVTPTATLVGFVALSEPQGYQGSEPAYSCKILLSPDDADNLVQTIDHAHANAGDYLNEIAQKFGNRPKLTAAKLRKHAPLPYEPEIDDQDQETGNTIFKFRQNSSQYSRGEKVPFSLPIIDSERMPMQETIYAGSKVKIKFVIKPWYVDSMGLGVSLRPQAVQCIELVSTYGSPKGEDFETVPGGYTAQATHNIATPPATPSSHNSDATIDDEWA